MSKGIVYRRSHTCSDNSGSLLLPPEPLRLCFFFSIVPAKDQKRNVDDSQHVLLATVVLIRFPIGTAILMFLKTHFVFRLLPVMCGSGRRVQKRPCLGKSKDVNQISHERTNKRITWGEKQLNNTETQSLESHDGTEQNSRVYSMQRRLIKN